jgi:hypothetical protein
MMPAAAEPSIFAPDSLPSSSQTPGGWWLSPRETLITGAFMLIVGVAAYVLLTLTNS